MTSASEPVVDSTNISPQIQFMCGDIVEQNVDAVVNAANEWLEHGAGVAGEKFIIYSIAIYATYCKYIIPNNKLIHSFL